MDIEVQLSRNHSKNFQSMFKDFTDWFNKIIVFEYTPITGLSVTLIFRTHCRFQLQSQVGGIGVALFKYRFFFTCLRRFRLVVIFGWVPRYLLIVVLADHFFLFLVRNSPKCVKSSFIMVSALHNIVG